LSAAAVDIFRTNKVAIGERERERERERRRKKLGKVLKEGVVL
jgi:hypothetical protein